MPMRRHPVSPVSALATRLFSRTGEYGRRMLSAVVTRRPPPGLAGADKELRQLELRIARIAGVAGGTVGAAAVHVETGRGVSVNGQVPFPMASTVKPLIALRVLALVDEGALSLDRMVPLAPGDVHPGSGILSRRFEVPGVELSVRNLLDLSLTVSDNSASDLLLDLAGGGTAVTTLLRSLGHHDIVVARPTSRMLADLVGIGELPAGVALAPGVWTKLCAGVTPEQRREAEHAFFSDGVRDTATPEALVRWLAQLARGEGLSAASASLLTAMMSRCDGGRLHTLLPGGARTARKTGTLNVPGPPPRRVLTAEVGFIDLPGGTGRIAIAVLVKRSPRSPGTQGRAIAGIAREVYRHVAAEVGGQGGHA